jgi:hypothetical protein
MSDVKKFAVKNVCPATISLLLPLQVTTPRIMKIILGLLLAFFAVGVFTARPVSVILIHLIYAQIAYLFIH